MTKFAILTCENSPILEPVLKYFKKFKVNNPTLLVDGKLSERDIEITLERMVPGYKIRSINDLDLKGIEILLVENHNSPETVSLIKERKFSYLLNGGTTRILKAPVLESSKGSLNCHPGLLPDYRGCSAVEWAIFNGDPVGATCHFMTAGIDEGPIIKKRKLNVSFGESYESIRTRMNDLQAELLAETCFELQTSQKSINDFPSQGAGHYYKPISPEQMKIVREKILSGQYSCQN